MGKLLDTDSPAEALASTFRALAQALSTDTHLLGCSSPDIPARRILVMLEEGYAAANADETGRLDDVLTLFGVIMDAMESMDAVGALVDYGLCDE